jgi:hypothetical protein
MMNDNSKFDNWFSNGVLAVVGTAVRTLERSFVVFWDGLRSATIHGTPSLLGFVAAVSPILAPLGTAIQTAFSLQTYMHMWLFQAVVLAISIEFIGFELWVFATETWLRDGWTGTTRQIVLTAGVVAYETILILINVMLAGQGLFSTLGGILFLMCFLPALAAVGYGFQNMEHKAMLERERQEAAELAERLRQERRQDRKEARAMKQPAPFRADGKPKGQ